MSRPTYVMRAAYATVLRRSEDPAADVEVTVRLSPLALQLLDRYAVDGRSRADVLTMALYSWPIELPELDG